MPYPAADIETETITGNGTAWIRLTVSGTYAVYYDRQCGNFEDKKRYAEGFRGSLYAARAFADELSGTIWK